MKAIDVLFAAAGIVLGGGAVALLYQVAPQALRSRNAVGVVVLAGATAATFAPAKPTVSALWDAALLAGLAAAASVAARHADRRVVLIVAAATMVMATLAGAAGILAGAAVGSAAVPYALGVRMPAIKALSGALVANTVAWAHWPDGLRGVGTGAVVITGLVVAGLARAAPATRRRIVLAALGISAITAAVAVVTLVVALSARRWVDDGVDRARAGLAAARAGAPAEAAAKLRAASADFARARRRLEAGPAWPARLVPVVAQNHRALRVMAEAGEELAAVGADAVGRAQFDDVRLRNGTLDLDAVRALASPARRSRTALLDADDDLSDIDSSVLVSPVRRALRRLEDEVDQSTAAAVTAVDTLRMLPALFGAGAPRRYFVAIQNNSEARALGGIIGSFAVLVGDNGRLRLDQIGRGEDLNRAGSPSRQLVGEDDYLSRYAEFRPERTWQNITVSPDGPSVARVIEQLYPQSGGTAVDGVVFLDPFALSRLLTLTGPVAVPGWPTPLTAENASGILLHEQYLRFPKPERVAFLSDVAKAVFDRLVAVDLPGPAEIGRALAPAIRGRHLALHSVRGAEQRLFRRLDLAGAFPTVQGDFAALVTQNGSGTKADWFLRRSLRYAVTYDPRRSTSQAVADIRLENTAPATGLPAYVIGGPGLSPTPAGASRLIVSFYSPLQLRRASLDGAPVAVETETEQGRFVYSTVLTLASGQAATLRLELGGTVPDRDGRYRLDLRAQPTVVPDEVTVSITGRRGARDIRFSADRDRRVEVRVS